MGGKRLKFPKRKKFVPGDNSSSGEVEDKPISEEEHKKRIALLQSMGIVKSTGNAESESQEN